VTVTVRAVRHYHAKGLLPERDRSGYRRYDAAAVVELIRIRTLAGAGVPLLRVRERLAAGDEEFAAAVEDIDRRLRAEIRERQRYRERIGQLTASDSRCVIVVYGSPDNLTPGLPPLPRNHLASPGDSQLDFAR